MHKRCSVYKLGGQLEEETNLLRGNLLRGSHHNKQRRKTDHIHINPMELHKIGISPLHGTQVFNFRNAWCPCEGSIVYGVVGPTRILLA